MLESRFSGLQRCPVQYGLTLIRLALLSPPSCAKSHEILRKFEFIAVQGHQKSSILVPTESVNFLLIINEIK